jgi:hypothetical protein
MESKMLNKIVNGVEAQCSAEEEAEILAEWAKNDALPKVPQGTPTPIEEQA